MELIQHILPSIEHLGKFGYWIVFISSFLETIVVVGTLMPGAVLVMIFGGFSAQGYFAFGDLVWLVASGAILGDCLAYYMGKRGISLFKEDNRLLKLAHLEKGRAFFDAHGNKSIFLGRFIGPLRSIVPFVAGLTQMRIRPFMFWNIFSGFVWAISHLLAGYFFGDAIGSIEKWSGRVSLFVIGAIVILSIFYLITKKPKVFEEF